MKRVTLFKTVGWIIFAVVQAFGVLIPRFTNIHSNIWPAFALLLLVPGVALVAVLGLTWGIVFAIPVNATLWWFAINRLESTRR